MKNHNLQRPYVLVGPDGVHYVGIHNSEDDCWKIALGWPSEEEILARKSEGFAVYPATLSWNKLNVQNTVSTTVYHSERNSYE